MKSIRSFIMTAVLFIPLLFVSLPTQAQNVRTVDVIGTNQMKYTVASKKKGLDVGKSVKGDNGKTEYLLKSILAKPGQKMKIVMQNYSKLPAGAMSHDWVLLKKNANASEVAKKSMQAKNNDYIAPGVKDEVIAHTDMVSGGQTSSVTFTVPQKTGQYEFICTFPGHYAAGMHGDLVVQK